LAVAAPFILWAGASASQDQAVRALAILSLATTHDFAAEGWSGVLEDVGHLYRTARGMQAAWVRLPSWWGEAARPPAGARYLIEISYRDDLTVPTPVRVYSGSAGFSEHLELHRIGGLGDRRWKKALVPVSWDTLRTRQGTTLAEFIVAPLTGALPVEQLSVLPIDPNAEQRYNAETRAWVARVQSQLSAPRHEVAAPQTAELTPEWQAHVLVPYTRPYTELLFPYAAPQAGEAGAPLRVRMAQGEYEPVTFGVYANGTDLHDVTIEVVFPADTPPLAPEVRTAEYALVPTGDGTLGTFPQRLWPAYPLVIPIGQSHWFWITLKTDPTATTPGTYQGQIKITAKEAAVTLPLQVEVLPFRLLSMQEAGLRMGACIRGLLPAHELDILREHNFNMLNIWFPGVSPQMSKQGDTIALDFSLLDEWMATAKARGMESMVWFLGGDPQGYPWTLSIERELYRVMYGTAEPYFDMVAKEKGTIPAVVKPLYAKWIREVWHHAQEHGWPELIFTPFDEPAKWSQDRGGAGSWIRSHFEEACGLVHQAAPGAKVYGSIHHAHGIVFLPVIDIFCTNAIDEDEHLGEKVRRTGKEFWQYRGGTGGAAGHPDQARSIFGFFFNAYDSRGHLVWAYNWGARFDTTQGANWLMAWHTPFDTIRTPFYEGIREGLDDRRYVETLKRLAQERGVDITAFLAALDAEAKQLGAPASQRVGGDFWSRARTSRQLDRLRQRVIEKILALR